MSPKQTLTPGWWQILQHQMLLKKHILITLFLQVIHQFIKHWLKNFKSKREKNPFRGLLQLWERKWGMAENAEAGLRGTKAAWPVSQNTLLLPSFYFPYSKEFYFYFAFNSPFLGLIFLVELRKSTKQVLFVRDVETSSLFNKEVLCLFLTCCTMGNKLPFTLCKFNHLSSCFTVPIAALIEISHSLKKYIVIKNSHIYIYTSEYFAGWEWEKLLTGLSV